MRWKFWKRNKSSLKLTIVYDSKTEAVTVNGEQADLLELELGSSPEYYTYRLYVRIPSKLHYVSQGRA